MNLTNRYPKLIPPDRLVENIMPWDKLISCTYEQEHNGSFECELLFMGLNSVERLEIVNKLCLNINKLDIPVPDNSEVIRLQDAIIYNLDTKPMNSYKMLYDIRVNIRSSTIILRGIH